MKLKGKTVTRFETNAGTALKVTAQVLLVTALALDGVATRKIRAQKTAA